MDWKLLIMGAGSGALWAMTGYGKNRGADGKLPPFKMKYMMASAVVGAFLGALASWKGITIQTYEEYAAYATANAGLVGIAQNLIKILFRHGKGWLDDYKTPIA